MIWIFIHFRFPVHPKCLIFLLSPDLHYTRGFSSVPPPLTCQPEQCSQPRQRFQMSFGDLGKQRAQFRQRSLRCDPTASRDSSTSQSIFASPDFCMQTNTPKSTQPLKPSAANMKGTQKTEPLRQFSLGLASSGKTGLRAVFSVC